MVLIFGVAIHINVDNFFSKYRSRDMLLVLKDTLSIEDEKCSRHADLFSRLFPTAIRSEVPEPKVSTLWGVFPIAQ